MLHESLLDLAEQAPSCITTSMARGVLSESIQLARNAASHGADAVELAAWTAGIVSDVLRSPALTGSGELLCLTGAFGRGEALPDSPLQLLGTNAEDLALARETLENAGYLLADSLCIDATAAASHDPEFIGAALDSGDVGLWLLQHSTLTKDELVALLLEDALNHRPPALRVVAGLPSKDALVDVRADLVVPTARFARWAGFAAGCRSTSTLLRLQAAEVAGILSPDESEYLTDAWESGMKVRMQRWFDHSSPTACRWADMPQLQRSVIGASCRMVADVARSIEHRGGSPWQAQ